MSHHNKKWANLHNRQIYSVGDISALPFQYHCYGAIVLALVALTTGFYGQVLLGGINLGTSHFSVHRDM